MSRIIQIISHRDDLVALDDRGDLWIYSGPWGYGTWSKMTGPL